MKKTEIDAYLESTKFRAGQCWKILHLAWGDHRTCAAIVQMAEDAGFKNPDEGTIRPRLNELEIAGLIKSSDRKTGRTARGNATVSYSITPWGWEVIKGNTALFRVGMMGVRGLIDDRAEAFARLMEKFKEERMAVIREQMSWYSSDGDVL